MSFDEHMARVGCSVAYINLCRRFDRRTRIERELAHAGMRAMRWPGRDGRSLSADDVNSLNRTACRPLRHGELGCYLSHTSLWRHADAWHWKRLWVLEDDVALGRSVQQLPHMLTVLDSLDPTWAVLHVKSASSTEAFYEVCSPEHIGPELSPLTPVGDRLLRDDIYKVGPQLGAWSYVLSVAGRDQCRRATTKVRNPIDVQIGQLIGTAPQYLWMTDGVQVTEDGMSDTR